MYRCTQEMPFQTEQQHSNGRVGYKNLPTISTEFKKSRSAANTTYKICDNDATIQTNACEV